MSKIEFDRKTESELKHDRSTIIHNMRVVWDRYINDHIAMLECTGIDDDGSLIYTDHYNDLRKKCADGIVMFEDLQKKLNDINEALKGVDV